MITAIPSTQSLLTKARKGQPLPMEGDAAVWVMLLMEAGYIRATVVPDESPKHLICRLIPKGQELLNGFRS
jgi:hypothetical protein